MTSECDCISSMHQSIVDFDYICPTTFNQRSNLGSEIKGPFTQHATQREAKVGNLREWWITSLTQNRATIHLQFCVSEAKQPLAKSATSCKFPQVIDDVAFWLLCFASCLNAP